MNIEPKTVLLLFGYILFNFYYIYIIVVCSKRFENVDDEIKFNKALKKTPEYKNQDLDKKFLKFFSKINKFYLSDEKIEKMYFDFLEGKEIKPQLKSYERKYLYVFTCVMLVINGLIIFTMLNNKEINQYIKFILVIIQLIFLYNLYLVIKNLSDEEISVSIDLLKKTIFFVFVCLFIFIMNLFNMFDSKNLKGMFKIFNKKLEKEEKVEKKQNNKSNNQNNNSNNSNNKLNKSNNSNNYMNDVEKILENNEKFLSNVSESLKK